MRWQWKKAPVTQLDLLDVESNASAKAHAQSREYASSSTVLAEQPLPLPVATPSIGKSGHPLMVLVALIDEDPSNPRTEFPEPDIDELANDIRQRGILQPLVVHPSGADGRYRLHFGAMRLRAARRACLESVPVTVRNVPTDPYAQVAENQKRRALTPLDLAHFIRAQAAAGESNATIAKRLGMNLTTVAHHLSLLDLPPVLEHALKSGRCTSPRTLHELSKLHDREPAVVHALVDGDAEITRAEVSAVRAARLRALSDAPATSCRADPVARANAACDRLEQALSRIDYIQDAASSPDLAALRQRIAGLAARCRQGV